jgi:hypothetical protein
MKETQSLCSTPQVLDWFKRLFLFRAISSYMSSCLIDEAQPRGLAICAEVSPFSTVKASHLRKFVRIIHELRFSLLHGILFSLQVILSLPVLSTSWPGPLIVLLSRPRLRLLLAVHLARHLPKELWPMRWHNAEVVEDKIHKEVEIVVGEILDGSGILDSTNFVHPRHPPCCRTLYPFLYSLYLPSLP